MSPHPLVLNVTLLSSIFIPCSSTPTSGFMLHPYTLWLFPFVPINSHEKVPMWKSSLEFYSLDHRDQTGKIMLEFFLQPQASRYTTLLLFYVSTITGSLIEDGNYTSTCRFVPRHSFVCVQTEAESVINWALVCKVDGSFMVRSPWSRSFGFMLYSFLPRSRWGMLRN